MGRVLWQTLSLAGTFSLAIFMHILSCALYENWWPLTTLLVYVLAPLPLCYLARSADAFESSKTGQHWAEFMVALLASLVVGVPFVMVHVSTIELGAALMGLTGFLLVCLTAVLAAWFARADDDGGGGLGLSLFGN